MEHAKVCPFAAANPQQENSDCLGDACACYVKMHKPRWIASAEYKMADPEYFYSYFGCGLVSHIPWQLAKREVKLKTAEGQMQEVR